MNSIYIKLKSRSVLFLIGLLSLLNTPNANAQKVGLDWVKQIGNQIDYQSFPDGGYGIAYDHEGNILSTGYYTANVDFDPGTNPQDTFYLTAMGQQSWQGTYISKLDKDGKFIWAKSIMAYQGYSIAVDKDDNVYVAGAFMGTVDFNPGKGVYNLTYVGTGQATFLLKLNAQGDFIWARKVTDGGMAQLTLDTAGYCYLVGTDTVGGAVYKYDPAGNIVFRRGFVNPPGSIGGASPADVSVDDSANIFITGTCGGVCDFDPGPGQYIVNTLGGSNIFILKLTATGNFAWVKSMGAVNTVGISGTNIGNGIKIDPFGNVAVVGRFLQPIDFNPGGTTPIILAPSPNTAASFVMMLKNNGDVLWAHSADTSNGYAVATDQSGNVYATGNFFGNVDFDPGPGVTILDNVVSTDVYMIKMDPKGNLVWAKQFGGTRSDIAEGIEVDKSGSIYLTGWFDGRADYDPGPDSAILTTDKPGSTGLYDIFILKLSCWDTTSYHRQVTTCQDIYELNNIFYNQSGTYQQVIPNASGCDSTIYLDLNIVPILKPNITVNVHVLGTTTVYDRYQWIQDGKPILGATDSIYTVTKNGLYSVVVTSNNNCSDTASYLVTNAEGIDNIANYAQSIKVYPNPSKDVVYIQSPVPVNAMLTATDGRQLLKTGNTTSVSLKNLSGGIYFLRLFDEKGNLVKVEKLLKE